MTNGNSKIIGLIVSVIVVLATVWGMIARPLETQLDAQKQQHAQQIQQLEGRLARVSEQSDQNRERIVAMREAFKEVETQFSAISKMRNIQLEESDRRVRMLWFKVYGEELPAITYFPEVGREGGSPNGNGH